MRLRVLLLVVTLCCALGAAPAVGTAASTTAPPSSVIASTAAMPCPPIGNVRCGAIRVPLDRADPAGGRIRIAYELFPRRDRSRPLLGTIVAVEGGPGYSSTGSRSYYLDLFEPLMDRRQLLIVDNRGTGKSEPILCQPLQSYRGNYVRAVGKCGRQLGNTSDVYGTTRAAHDLADVLDHLNIRQVDLYGDSYGTFFSQSFAVQYPERLRTLTLDAAYFVAGTDPWYSDTNRALTRAFSAACHRSPACARLPGSSMRRISRLAELLRHSPIAGRAPNADGKTRRIVVNVGGLIDLVTGAATSPTIYRELDAAARAVLRPRPYKLPLLRLARETKYVGGAGPVRWYSEGLYAAVSCNDYPQPFDIGAPFAKRRLQYNAAVSRLDRNRPHIFSPFTVREWTGSPYGYYDSCLRWPSPSRWVPPVPPAARFPNVPTLVLDGDLDSLTSPEGARMTAAAFPNSTFVRVANMTHVSALVDFGQCASLLVRRFVRSRSVGDTSCAGDYHENRLVARFARKAGELGWSRPAGRAAKVAAATVGDVIARWLSMADGKGVGLRGGTFTTHGGGFRQQPPVAHWTLHKVRWVADVSVSGTARWNRRTGQVTARVTTTGPGAPTSKWFLRWNDLDRHSQASATGMVRGHRVRLVFPAP